MKNHLIKIAALVGIALASTACGASEASTTNEVAFSSSDNSVDKMRAEIAQVANTGAAAGAEAGAAYSDGETTSFIAEAVEVAARIYDEVVADIAEAMPEAMPTEAGDEPTTAYDRAREREMWNHFRSAMNDVARAWDEADIGAINQWMACGEQLTPEAYALATLLVEATIGMSLGDALREAELEPVSFDLEAETITYTMSGSLAEMDSEAGAEATVKRFGGVWIDVDDLAEC